MHLWNKYSRNGGKEVFAAMELKSPCSLVRLIFKDDVAVVFLSVNIYCMDVTFVMICKTIG